MNDLAKTITADPSLHFLHRDGEMRKRIREFDWSKTELGHPGSWSASLKTAVTLMLDCACPAYIAWGPNFIQLYNDAYIPILGELKHPHALGSTSPETWQEIWNIVGPLFNSILATGQAVSMANKMMPMQRNGYQEECYFSFSFSPLTDEAGRITGIFAIPLETTLEFISYRHANTVRMLAQGLSDATDMGGIRAAFKKTVRENPQDLPFGLWYEIREDRSGLDLVAAAGIQSGSPLSPEYIDSSHGSFYKGLVNIASPVVRSCSFAAGLLHWERPQAPEVNPQVMLIKPLCCSNYQHPDDYVILAVNPMRPNDEIQREFLQTIRIHLENAVRRVKTFDLERREQEHQFQTVMAVLPCLVWMSDTSMACIFVNQTWIDFTGCQLDQVVKNCWHEVLHPEDIGELARYRNAFKGRAAATLEYRLKHASGEYRWMLDEARPRYDINGEFLGYIGTCIDITERKKAEQKIFNSEIELRMLYERLQTVREEERRVLAREVHDQLGQILSAAKIDIKLLEEEIRTVEGAFSRDKVVAELQSASSTIESAIQVVRRLATELRPPELETQGLPAAIQWHAHDFERRTKIRCNLILDPDIDVPHLQDAIAVALFRIFQEAMTNILRHAKANRVWICLGCRGDRIQLRVRDNGTGISKEQARSARSIGLKGMHERAAIAGGRLVVGPLKSSGTLVTASVPLVEDRSSSSLAMPVTLDSGEKQ